MTRRERILAVCMGGTLAGVAVWYATKALVVGPFQKVQSRIDNAQTLAAELRAEQRSLRDIRAQWADYAAQTYAADPKEAQRRFREDVHRLLERHGLTDPKVSPGTIIRNKNETFEVPLTINANGTLNKIVGFLRDFYRREQLTKLVKVRIFAEQSVISQYNSERAQSRRRGRSDGFGADGPELKLSVSAVTLVLPELPEIPFNPTPAPEERERGRLVRDPDAYQAIVAKNPFKPYEPERIIRDVPQPPVDPGPVLREPDPRPRPNPRPYADKQYVSITACLDNDLVAYVYDERPDVRDPVTRYSLDARIDDGTLLLIHRDGIVVRVVQEGDPIDYFYALGTRFIDRKPLNPQDHPDVWEALQREFMEVPVEAAPAARHASAETQGR